MTCFLNPLADRSMISRGRPILSCHLFADDPDDLLDICEKIGFPLAYLRRSPSGVLFGELSESYRLKAVAHGAVQLGHGEAFRKWCSLGKPKARRAACTATS